MILSIESSCDDSSLALTKISDNSLIYHKKISQDDELKEFGGVVPELASRLHAIALPNIFKDMYNFLQHNLSEIKAVAVTTHPGLSVTLIEGLTLGKTISLSLNVPIISVNHLKGHIYSLFINEDCLTSDAYFPLSVLLVSGGHTQILEVKSFDDIYLISQTLDDSFGESFDKVAKMLNLGYPGGMIIENQAKLGTNPIAFSVPMEKGDGHNNINFSFSGLKNAVRLEINNAKKNNYFNDDFIHNLCAGFQQTAIKHVSNKFKKYLNGLDVKPKFIAIVGGASANQSLRNEFQNIANSIDSKLLLSKMEYCSDNAAMIGRVGIEHYKRKDFSDMSLNVTPRINEFKTH